MSRFWSSVVDGLTPYVPGEQPRHERLVKLNTNESPYPPAPGVFDAITATSADMLRRYPDPESQELQRELAKFHQLQPEQVFLGNGSDEVLAHVFMALLQRDAPLLLPDISYSFYPVWCKLYGIEYRSVPLSAAYCIDVTAYRQAAGGIVLPNPNAPTGILLPLADIRTLLDEHCDCVVVVDEAYIDFGGESAVSLIDSYENLLVVQTFSKSRALAGMRIGAALGHTDLIAGLNRLKNSFNSYPLDAVAQRAGVASLRDDDYFRQCCERIIVTRDRLTARLQTLGFYVLPSVANFILARPPGSAAKQVFEALRERGIIVRYFDQPRLNEYLRISIGTDEQSDALVNAVNEILALTQ